MANADVEKSGYSGFERFLFFVTPVLFTAVLLGVLLLLFNEDWRKSALEIGNKIPLLNAVLPEPSSSAAPPQTEEEITVHNAKVKVEELEAILRDREAALKQATDQTAQQERTIADLTAQVDKLNAQTAEQTITAEQYAARIRELAAMYSKMTPSKAAPILESLTVEEAALVLDAMDDNVRSRVLERMNPQMAADVTMQLKDAAQVEDKQIAALQARIAELEQRLGQDASTLDADELSRTYSAMNPNQAAKLLIEMSAVNQGKALRILGLMTDNARSQVLAAMTEQDEKKAAQLAEKLVPANS